MADRHSLAAALRRYPDPVASADPVLSTLVTRLASLPAPIPSPGFREELRAQLMAVTPRLVAEGLTPAAGAAVRAGRVPGRMRATWQRVPMRRPLAVLGTLVVIFGVLLTGAVWLSSNTLPGDSLYALKRAGENVQLSLTSGDAARGKEYLTFAERRAGEVEKLLSQPAALAGGAGPHAGAGISQHTSKLVTETLADADSDIRSASRLLTGQSVRAASTDPLQALLTWTPDQVTRLKAIVERIPAGSLYVRAVASEQLAERVLDRAARLHATIGCRCLNETSSDDLGPLPCTLPCNPAAAPPPSASGGAVPVPGGGGLPKAGATTGASPTLPATRNLSTTAATGTSAAAGSNSTRGPLLPSLPQVSLPSSGPVAVNSCGLNARLGKVGIGLGPCGLHLHL
jgi:hypothetical protein